LFNHCVPQSFYFGTATKNRNNRVNANTVFEIASVTKVFTSVLLAYEFNQGLVRLDDPVIKYLRNAPRTNPTFNKITLQGLATHVLGLGQMPASTVKNRTQLMQSLRNWHPPYKLNSWWKYSNVGFGLLGYVLEDVSHKSYSALLKQALLVPLQMNSTSLTGSSCFACAQGYSWNGKAVNTTKALLTIPAAGSIRSSGHDMQKFLAAALNLPGTPPAVASAMRITQMPFYRTPYGAQGLGWEIHSLNKMGMDGYVRDPVRTLTLHSGAVSPVAYPAPLSGRVLYDKTGSVAGFRAYIAVIPATQTGIVIMVNSAMPRTQVVLAARKVLLELSSR
jgi:beta-lactamase class C